MYGEEYFSHYIGLLFVCHHSIRLDDGDITLVPCPEDAAGSSDKIDGHFCSGSGVHVSSRMIHKTLRSG